MRIATFVLAVSLWGCGAEAEEPVVAPGPPQSFGVMTFNVLCSFCDGTYDPWPERLAYFEDIFERYEPDLIGLQEIAFESEVGEVLALRPGFAATYFVNQETAVAYPDATVLYREARFELVSRGDYWLSPTPDVPSSTGFVEQQLPRLVEWVELRDRVSHRSLYFATTHFDNNAPSQDESAPLLLERTAPWAERMPVVVVGDFNSQTYDPAYEALEAELVNAEELAVSSTVEHNQASEPAYDFAERIDHIFLAPKAGWSVERWAVDLHVYGANDRYPSDHFAMFAEVLAPGDQ